MVQGNAAAAWDRAAIDEAKRLCDALIAQAQGVLVGESSFSGEFLFVFIDTAEGLLQLLESCATPLSDKVQYFRDHIATWSEDYPGQQPDRRFFKPFSALGLPVYDEDGIPFDIVAGLTGEWLALMREFRGEIAAIQPYSKRRMRQSKGGRPKDASTQQLHADVQRLFADEASSLRRNGLSNAAVQEQLRRLTATDVLTQINEKYERGYRLVDSLKKKVTRSPTWQECRSDSSKTASTGSEDSPRHHAQKANHSWAAESGLATSSRPHQRTKLSRR
jgi:hypothetical protein